VTCCEGLEMQEGIGSRFKARDYCGEGGELER